MAGGGAERIVSTIVHELRDEFSITLVLINDEITYDLPDNISIVVLPGINESNVVAKFLNIGVLAFRLAKLSSSKKIDCTFSLATRPNLINSLSGFFGNKSIIIIYEVTTPSVVYSSNKIMRYLIKKIYPMAERMIANSYGASNDLKTEFKIINKIKTIYSPIDIEYIHEQASVPCSSIDDNDDLINLITVGRLDYGKNHEMMIRAFVDIKNKNTLLYILGEGDLEVSLRQLTRELDASDRVIFLGFDSNPFKYLVKCDVFLFSTRFEGFPTVLIEALACQLPIISTDCKSGPREILANNMTDATVGFEVCDYGVLVELDNQNAFTKAIDLMLDNDKLRWSYINKATSRANYFSKDKSILGIKQSILNNS